MKPEVKEFLFDKVTEELMVALGELDCYKKLIDIKDNSISNLEKRNKQLEEELEALKVKNEELENKLLLSQTMNDIDRDIKKGVKVGRPKKY